MFPRQKKIVASTVTLQDDNCGVHRAKSVCDLFEEDDGTLEHTDWLSKLLDLNAKTCGTAGETQK